MRIFHADCPTCGSRIHTNSRPIAREILRHSCDVCRGISLDLDPEPSWIRFRLMGGLW